MRYSLPLALAALTWASGVVLVSHPREALACGGCFHGVDEATPSVVTGHRMALAMSKERTVLWDQVEYAGEPSDFAWVLPVGEGAYIEEADDAFFEALEAVTATRVMSTVLTCNDRVFAQQESAGCAGGRPLEPVEPRSADVSQQGNVRGVTVEHQGTVGPYETATIKSADPQALRTWLELNKYVIPADINPVIDAYVAEGAAFIALRLKPGVGVQQMTPVRVITPGASPILPLRMVAAGTGASVSIVLYVLAEGRYGAQDRPEAAIAAADMTWDWSMSRSDYAELRDEALKDGAFLTSFAVPKGFTAEIVTTDGSIAEYDVVDAAASMVETHTNLADLYFAQAAANDGLPNACAKAAATLRSLTPGTVVAAPCDGDPMCTPPPASISAKELECDGHSDLATALLGTRPDDVWVTRLEANLPRAALSTDLTLGASMSQSEVPNWHVAQKNINEPACGPSQPQGNASSSASDESRGCVLSPRSARASGAFLSAMAASALLFGARRLARRRR